MSSDRPALEIEITKEMIEAGINAIDPLDSGLLMPSDEVSAIWLVMESVRRGYLD